VTQTDVHESMGSVKSSCCSIPFHEEERKISEMKKNARFPKSNYSDDARVDYLARGMAGVMCGKSPMTGIEKLRNMKHDKNGPLWTRREGNRELPEIEQHCDCWRCNIQTSSNRASAPPTRTALDCLWRFPQIRRCRLSGAGRAQFCLERGTKTG
jgi:hypothetical protein